MRRNKVIKVIGIITVASFVAVMLISYRVIIPELNKTPEMITVIQTELIAPKIHIETEKAEETPRTYQNVEFVTLIEHESNFDRTARSQRNL